MLATRRKRHDVRRLKAGEDRARRHRTPIVVRRSNSPLEVALTHSRPHERWWAIARTFPFQRDAAEIWLPREVDPRATLKRSESVLNVLRVLARLWLCRVVTSEGDDVAVPVRRL